jgi:hypothetical protein
MRATWLRFGILAAIVALAIVSVLLSFRANIISRERKAVVRIERGDVETRLVGGPDENEPVTEFFVGQRVSTVELIRDYPRHERLDPDKLAALADLKQLENLRISGFDLDDSHVDALPILTSLREFAWSVDLGTDDVGQILAGICERTPNLERLYLAVPISDSDLESIPQLRRVRVLFVRSDRVRGTFLPALSDGCLEELTLACDDLTPGAFAGLEDVKTLRRVDLSASKRLPVLSLDLVNRLEYIEELRFHVVPATISEEKVDSMNREIGDRYELLWPEASFDMGGDGWVFERGKKGK